MSKINSIKKRFVFRFYAELNDFLPEQRRQREFEEWFKTPINVGDTLVSFGIPFSEVDLILVNGESANVKHSLKENDRVSVYPQFESMDIRGQTQLRKIPLRDTKFILDCHLGKLTRYLRMLGFDCFYKNQMDDEAIIDKSLHEGRIILTRDKLLLKSERITHAYYVRSIEKHEQLREVVQKFDLYQQFKSFSRCISCNAKLQVVDKKWVQTRVDEDTYRIFDRFFYCTACDKVFWKGSHFKRMEHYIRDLLKER